LPDGIVISVNFKTGDQKRLIGERNVLVGWTMLKMRLTIKGFSLY